MFHLSVLDPTPMVTMFAELIFNPYKLFISYSRDRGASINLYAPVQITSVRWNKVVIIELFCCQYSSIKENAFCTKIFDSYFTLNSRRI